MAPRRDHQVAVVVWVAVEHHQRERPRVEHQAAAALTGAGRTETEDAFAARACRRCAGRHRARAPTAAAVAACGRLRPSGLGGRGLTRSALGRPARAIEARAQLLTGAEEGHALGFDGDHVAGARIAALAGAALLDPEAAEAADFDSSTAGQHAGHLFEHRVDDGLGLAMREFLMPGQQFLDDAALGHRTTCAPAYSQPPGASRRRASGRVF